MKKIYANALLSDGKILFWRTSPNKKDIEGFYKEFYYADINQLEYFATHTMVSETMCFEFDNDEMNEFVFDVLAVKFYKQFKISKDFKGKKPY